MARHCTLCRQAGHYSKTCSRPKQVVAPPTSTTTLPVATASSDMPTSDGVSEPITPYTHRGYRQGLWLVNMDKGRLAGKIKRITRDSVIYDSLSGAEVESSIKNIVNSNYISVDLEPVHVVKFLESHKVKDYY